MTVEGTDMSATTDGVTLISSARDEADRRWPQSSPDFKRHVKKTPLEWLDEGMASGFVLGAQWAATRIHNEGRPDD